MFGQSQQCPVHGESGKQRVTIFSPMLRVVSLLALVLIVTVGFIALLSNHPGKASANAGSGNPNSVVGVWFVNAIGAPFQPHLERSRQLKMRGICPGLLRQGAGYA